jgi:large subunit ribosomal protein L15e
MGFYKYVKQQFEQEQEKRTGSLRQRLVAWSKQAAVERIEKPTNLARARELGYKAKKEFVVARVKTAKGRRKRRKPDQGRKSNKRLKFVPPAAGLQWIAEQRAARRFPNLRVVNSYFVGETGQEKFFEVILVNPVLRAKK